MNYRSFRQLIWHIGCVAILCPMLCFSSVTAGDMPRGIRLQISRTIGCTNGSGAREFIPQRTLNFQIYITRNGEIFDFDSAARDRGVRYIPDGRSHPFTKITQIGGQKLVSRGNALAEWKNGILELQESHVLQTSNLMNIISDYSIYSVDVNNKSCATRSVDFSRRYTENSALVVDITCNRLISQSCRLEVRP